MEYVQREHGVCTERRLQSAFQLTAIMLGQNSLRSFYKMLVGSPKLQRKPRDDQRVSVVTPKFGTRFSCAKLGSGPNVRTRPHRLLTVILSCITFIKLPLVKPSETS